jgi:hypothetical protein
MGTSQDRPDYRNRKQNARLPIPVIKNAPYWGAQHANQRGKGVDEADLQPA